MLNDTPVLKWTLVALLVLLVVPLIGMLLMMVIGATTGATMMSGMMSHMGGMMGGGTGTMGRGGATMILSFVWMALVAAALVALILLLMRGTTHP